jgi:catechol 2,3-dioxygenase-like lactoylglutathione lyase family enzyme
VPNIESDHIDESREFYGDFLGLEVAMDMGWIVTFASPSNPTAQISFIQQDASATIHADLSIEVADVDAVHAAARARGKQIVYPLTDEPWGVRRFFVADPNGVIVNVVSHRRESESPA